MVKGRDAARVALNAYASGTMGSIAGIAAFGAFIGARVLLLSVLGLWHGRRLPPPAQAVSADRDELCPRRRQLTLAGSPC
jgi:hypothetical protein